MAYLLDAGAAITCPHGGQVTATAATSNVSVAGQPPLLPTDGFSVSGCTFNISGAPSPCIQVRWTAPSANVSVRGTPVLLSSSIGLCVSAAQAPQGTALVTGFQTRVSGR